MDSQAVATWIGDGGLIIAAVGALLCVCWYSRVPWWRSPMGRHLFAYQAVIASVLILGVVRIFFGDNDFWVYLRLLTFLGVPIVIWWQWILILKANRKR